MEKRGINGWIIFSGQTSDVQTHQGAVSTVLRSSVMPRAAGGEQVVGPSQVEEQRGSSAGWALKIDVEVTPNGDSVGMDSKTKGKGVG